jgi:dephospho-CoA kinase
MAGREQMHRTAVIGVAGGIGSGKSAFARALGNLGARVFDADVSAKRALDDPEVRASLEGWWGPDVVGTDGRIDRARIATIVFGDASARRRLEELVHPRVRAEAAAFIEEARRSGARAVILDVPLLFESGMDSMCDLVVFVEAPESVRAARVGATRGWDSGELARREAVQWPLEEKRRLSGVVVVNDGASESDLDAEALRAYSIACPVTGA